MMEATSFFMEEPCVFEIDRLPDELLCSIVSFLAVAEAARTSILARRWQHFWKYCRILNFNGTNMLLRMRSRREGGSPEHVRMSFVSRVDSVLNSHLGETIDEFKVFFYLDCTYAYNIDRWIEFALTKKVKILELNMLWRSFGRQYVFPNIFRPTHNLSCESLQSLYLMKVNIGAEVLECCISQCPFLEELYIEGANGLEIWRPRCQARRLRLLTMISCVPFKWLEISSPNLESFTFVTSSEDYITMAIKDVSSLTCVHLGARIPMDLSNNLLELSGCLARLEVLILQTTTMMDDKELEFPSFPSLKKVEFEINASMGGSLLCFTSLINAAPFLHEIVLKMQWDRSRIKQLAASQDRGPKHQYLKVFEAIGFSSRGVGAELALHVIENAASLDQIIINRKVLSREGFDGLKAKIIRNIVCTA